MRDTARTLVPAALTALLAGCGTDLPPGTTSFTVGRTTVRTDSALDYVGVLWRLADTAQVPPRGPVRRWLHAMQTQLGDTAFAVARAAGALPVSTLLETWADPERVDSVCGLVAPGTRRCFTGNAAVRAAVRDLIAAGLAFSTTVRAADLELLDEASRRRDLADVYVALTTAKSLDSAVAAYSGYPDLTFDVTLARTAATVGTTAPIDPARAVGRPPRIFLSPDQVYPTRAFRSPSYIWLALGHQMAHAVVRRLFDERPDLLDHGWHLRPAVESEVARVGYTAVFWNEALEEQLARAVTIRILQATSPTITWAARAEALNTAMALVPWLEDRLAIYESDRARWRLRPGARRGARLDPHRPLPLGAEPRRRARRRGAAPRHRGLGGPGVALRPGRPARRRHGGLRGGGQCLRRQPPPAHAAAGAEVGAAPALRTLVRRDPAPRRDVRHQRAGRLGGPPPGADREPGAQRRGRPGRDAGGQPADLPLGDAGDPPPALTVYRRSSTSRTRAESPHGVNGFCRNGVLASSAPCLRMASSV
jgi:hypothetical protein